MACHEGDNTTNKYVYQDYNMPSESNPAPSKVELVTTCLWTGELPKDHYI